MLAASLSNRWLVLGFKNFEISFVPHCLLEHDYLLDSGSLKYSDPMRLTFDCFELNPSSEVYSTCL